MVCVIQVCWQLASRMRMELKSFPLSEVFHCTYSNGMCHTGLLTACEQDQDETAVPFWSCSQDVSKPVWHIPLLCIQWKTPDDGQRNCPKHVEFNSKNKFEKLLQLVGFIIRNLSRCTVTWTSNVLVTSTLHLNAFTISVFRRLKGQFLV